MTTTYTFTNGPVDRRLFKNTRQGTWLGCGQVPPDSLSAMHSVVHQTRRHVVRNI